MIKGKCTKLLAAALSLVMLFGMLPVSAFAAGPSAAITFGYAYQSNGSQMYYQDSFTGTHGHVGGSGKPLTQIYVNGEEAYCIEPGAPLHTGDTLITNASETWDNLGAATQNAVKMALAFGKPGNEGALVGSGDAKHIATQIVIWEFVNGYRDVNSYALLDSGAYEAFCAGGANAEVAASYQALVSAMQSWDIVPSFANGKTYEMSYKDGKYVVEINDSNGVLGSYAVSSSDSKVQISKNGNTITLTCDGYLSKDPTITVTKTSNISASAILVPYGSDALQDVVSGVTRVGDVAASFKVSTPGGTLKMVKTSEDGIVEGVKLTVTGKDYNKVLTTGKDGSISIEGLIPGTYTVSEAAAGYYEPQDAQTVTITSGETATVKFNNTLKRGNLSVSKTSEDGFVEGMKFHLTGISASGSLVDLYAVTDSTGVATFNDVPVAGVSGYTLEEVDTAIRYVIPENQNVTVSWKDMTGATVSNILKKFNVTVTKSDVETSTAQGDATLAGAVYGLYQGDKLVQKYITDSTGCFTTDYFVCGNNWTIREITPSEGYLLDETVYHVGAEPENYDIELNHAPALNSYEQVIKGNISIIKHSDDGSTQIETPEVGAAFLIYRTEAGSFENAKESERDGLTCDDDGFAKTKDLPYGLYTVHQTAGNPDTEFMRDFTVFISENGKTYKYLINNAPYSAYIKVVKADAETGSTIPLTGAGFEIYDAAGNKISMSYTYPTLTTIDTFYVSEDGYLITPQKLDVGKYKLVEVQAPYGYVLNSTPIDFTVTSSGNEDLEGLCVITVTAYDMAQKGTISITKSGEVFTSVNVTGEEGAVDKDGTWGIINPIYSAVYEVQNLMGASYQVIAEEDIVTGDGTRRAEAGQVVAEITTDENGIASTGELYLGKYRIVETGAPEGFVLNADAQIVELTYAGQEVSVTSTSTSYVNDRQKLQLSAVKALEIDDAFGIGMNGEMTAVSFGLYAKKAITAADGSVIPADGLMEIVFADENGNIRFKSDLPFGSYYVKELTTDPHYKLDETIYDVEFGYTGQNVAIQTIALSDSAIVNTIKYGKIEGFKVNDEVADGKEYGLEGAVFGIFTEGTMELDEAHAIMTVTSDKDGHFVFEKVPYGDYVVVELKAPESYALSDARHFVSITYADQRIGLRVINYPIIGSVTLTKVDKDYPENHLAGAEFTVYQDVNGDKTIDSKDKKLGTMTEYENGVYRMDGLRSGQYIVKETKAPKGFLLDENSYAFAITEDGQIAVIENEAGVGFADQIIMGQITICKTDKASGSKLIGAGFRVCDKDGKVVAEGKTGEDGTVTFKLRYGEYTVAEYEAPKGYVLDDTPYSFTIDKDGQKLSVDMANTKITGKLVISKVDADTQNLLPNAGFRIYAADGKTVLKEGRTDKNGVCEFTLEFGKYYYQEFDAPSGYKIDDTKYEFSITENGKMVSVMMTNQKDEKPKDPTPITTPSKDGPKTGDDSNIGVWAAIMAVALAVGGVSVFWLYSMGDDDEKKRK